MGSHESDTTEQLSPTHTRDGERILGFPFNNLSSGAAEGHAQKLGAWPERPRDSSFLPGSGWQESSDCLWSSLQHSTQSVTTIY